METAEGVSRLSLGHSNRMTISTICCFKPDIYPDPSENSHGDLSKTSSQRYVMFYCILKIGSDYFIEDQANVRDPKVPWEEVRVKKGRDWQKACTKQTAAKTDGLSTAVDKLRDQLPPPPIAPQYGMYEGLTEQAVAALDCREDSILVFAGKLDRALFNRTYRPHQERDQVRLQWLIEVVLHRRRSSVGDQIKYWKSAILQRINLNASREDPISTSGTLYTPPVLLSSSRVIDHSTSRSFHPQPTSSQFSATPSHSTPSHFRATPSPSHGHFMANSSHNQPRIPMRQQGVNFRNCYDPNFDPDNFVGSRPN
ncbi:hypothetical protein PRIPAC_76738 [Pristionchus pacificus]|uniref:Uncharacterized protein n=1 Tax=Pristionchus pacificus TaxID=54126 RepID=A0A2A6CNH8_PRIPA|nr:hypothetical protein PRIPAC_76738 [Pristionchus pacificus]|eukprot:PDM79637.1 hypothetical protein PRIPAC_32216 [Pristionchus pacificus]